MSRKKAGDRREKAKPIQEKKMEGTIEHLVKQLEKEPNPQESSAVYNSLMNSPWRPHLMEFLLGEKDVVRREMDMSFYESSTVHVHKIDHILADLEALEVDDTDDDGKDDDSDWKIEEKEQKEKLKDIKDMYTESMKELQEEATNRKFQAQQLLSNQMKLRPIIQSDIDSVMEGIDKRFQQCEEDVKQVITAQYMLIRNRMTDNRKRRRNFTKEATKIMQDYYEEHAENPYPSEEEKEKLAVKCQITRQQVSNWFGNRRIRKKKMQAVDHHSGESSPYVEKSPTPEDVVEEERVHFYQAEQLTPFDSAPAPAEANYFEFYPEPQPSNNHELEISEVLSSSMEFV